jgi:ABC-2 type transport system permease protein
MRNVLAIFQRELRAYFASPIVYVMATIFLLITGSFFYLTVRAYAEASLRAAGQPFAATYLNSTEIVFRPIFANVWIIMLLMMPLLTMRLFAEERRQGTIELLLSYPVRDGDVILGKLLAVFTAFALMLVLTFAYPAYIAAVGTVEWGPLVTGYLGLVALAFALFAWGMFFSTLTENQIVAALIGFGFALFAFILGWLGDATQGLVSTVLRYLSIQGHLDSFARGVLDTRDIVYYVLATTLGLFLTWRTLDARRWRA